MAKPIDVIKKGGTEDKTKTGEVLVEKKVVPYQAQYYRGFGSEGEDAYKSGWIAGDSPAMGKRYFTNTYTNALTQVKIPNDPRLGHVALLAGDNGKFDVVIRNADGKPLNTPLANTSYQQAKQYVSDVLLKSRYNQVLKEDAKQPTNTSMAIFK